MRALAAAVLALSSSLAVAAPHGPLVALLEARQARLDALLARSSGPLSAGDKERLEALLSETIDFAEMGRAALGEEWSKRSDAEREQYVRAFEGLVRASLVRKPEVYRVRSVSYDREATEGARGQVVTTVRSAEATTEVSYTFARTPGGWRIVDYAIDGVSTVRNYRSQFARLLARRGFQAFVERLRARRTEIESGR